MNCDDIESLLIEIINNHSKNILNMVYRPPDGDLSITETLSEKLFLKIPKLTKHFSW